MANAINLSALNEYVEQRSEELLTKSVLGGDTLDVIDVMLDVKYKSPLNYLSSSITFGDASTCGWDPTGSDVFTQRMIEVFPVKVNKEWCARDMRKYWMNYQLLIDANRETLPFEQKLIDENIKAINVELDKEIWQNDASSLFPGLVYTLVVDCSTDIIDASIDTSAGIVAEDVIEAAYDNMTDEMLELNPYIFVSPTIYRNYIKGLNAVCCSNRDIVDAASNSIGYPGDSRVTIKSTIGLAGAEDANGKDVLAIATEPKNLVFGTDVENSENDFKVWYDDKDEMTRFKVLFNAGTQVKFPDQVVYVHEK